MNKCLYIFKIKIVKIFSTNIHNSFSLEKLDEGGKQGREKAVSRKLLVRAQLWWLSLKLAAESDWGANMKSDNRTARTRRGYQKHD